MTDQPSLEEAPGRLDQQVEKALELLHLDPRTSELAEMLPAIIQMAAAQSGLDPEQAQLKKGELADVFQAVYDAWGQAAVDVADREFRAASLAEGGNPVQPLR